MSQYWIGRDGRKSGPLDRATAMADYARGAIAPDDLVWTEGMREWAPASTLLAGGHSLPAGSPLTLEPLAEPPADTPYRTPTAKVVADVAAGAGDYAGFWVRFAAYALDQVIASVLVIVIAIACGAIAVFIGFSVEKIGWIGGPLGIVIAWLYYAQGESSPHCATIGKRAFRLRVVRAGSLERVGFGRATGRYYARAVSILILYIGYLMQPFTAKKQALHDMMCDTVVLQTARAPTWAVALVVLLAGAVPIIGVLAAIAIPAYQDYSVRARVHQALVGTTTAKAAVESYVTRNKRAPASLREAGYTRPPGQDGIRTITLNAKNALLTVELDFEPVRGQTVLLTPAITASDQMTWSCRHGTVPEKYLPASCREAR